MIKLVSEFISVFFLVVISFSLVFGSFILDLNALTIKQNDALIERIAKDFSKKFCNGVAFGLSQESAMNFAIKENMATFSKRKGVENIDNVALAEKVSISVSDKCGYLLDFSEKELFFNFKKKDLNG
tara:strand:- start:1423 stop:1803 length:381 start_codon:yes stop_codon:yes gene_type:complete